MELATSSTKHRFLLYVLPCTPSRYRACHSLRLASVLLIQSREGHGLRIRGPKCYFRGHMAVVVEMIHTRCAPEVRAEVAAMAEHALSDRTGDWRVLIVGSQADDRWEMKITGPNGFERCYTLEESAGQHEPRTVGDLVRKMVSVTR